MKKILLICAAAMSVVPMKAQVDEFKEFRQKVLADFQDFRSTVLSHYADFLEGKWHEYEPIAPQKRSEAPKPVKMPDVKFNAPVIGQVTLPEPVLGAITPNDVPRTPLADNSVPEADRISNAGGGSDPVSNIPSPFAAPKCEIPQEAKGEVPLTLNVRPTLGEPILGSVPKLPIPVVAEEVAAEPEEDTDGKEKVNFYGMEIWVPEVNFTINKQLEKVSDFARHWKILDQQDVFNKVSAALDPKMGEMGLNDYLKFEFICAYLDSKFPDSALSPKLSAAHYMITNKGFNARIAVTSQTGEPIVLIPAAQQLYGITYLKLNGQNFYILGNRDAKIIGQTFATCDLPKVAQEGKKFDMTIEGLNLPVKERKFDISHKDMHLTGVVNENLMPVVYRYPQMETSDYAISCLDKNLRDDLVRQVREQLGGKEKLAATNQLLQFVQEGFEYSTDDDFHGFEKPYFLEENLFYPKNDCEDRAIFYTYLLWNALETENQLLAFPGHESASVTIPGVEIKGTSYMHDGKRYYISDPTYIGSSTGQCMRSFETTAPKIDYTYGSK